MPSRIGKAQSAASVWVVLASCSAAFSSKVGSAGAQNTPLRCGSAITVVSAAYAASASQPNPSAPSRLSALLRLSIPDCCLSAMSLSSGTQKKFAATIRARAARSLFLAISASCVRKVAKVGSFTPGGSVIGTGLEGPSAGGGDCAGAGACAGGGDWAVTAIGASAPAITSAAATAWAQERRGCRIASSPRFQERKLAPDLVRSTARKKGLGLYSRARRVRWRDGRKDLLSPVACVRYAA